MSRHVEKIKFSIITATYNSGATIDDCIQSVLSQEGVELEHIIQDGSSIDSTSSIVKRYADRRISFESVDDVGVYDAWNKALKRVTGDWVIFLGSDDVLHDPFVLRNISQEIYKKDLFREIIIYGKVLKETPQGELIGFRGEPWSVMKLRYDLPTLEFPPHPACFFNIEAFKESDNFNLYFKLCADSLHIGLILKNHSPKFVNIVVTRFRTGGLTNNSRYQCLKWREKYKLNKLLNINVPFYLVFWSFVKLSRRCVARWIK